MDDTQDTPRAIKRKAVRISRREPSPAPSSFSSASLSYPQIPSRRSSLSMSTGYQSSLSGLATSTRTPSLADSLYDLQLPKTRQDNSNNDSDTPGTEELATSEDPFIDRRPRRRPVPRGLMTASGYQLAPHLTIRWGSGSYASMQQGSTESTSTSGSASDRMGQVSQPTSRVTLENIPSHSSNTRTRPGLMSQLEVPVAFANIRSYAAMPCIGPDSTMSVWTSVKVTADVKPLPLPENAGMSHLDIMILFDTPQNPTVSLLSPMILASSLLASHLVPNQDRLAIACVDGRTKRGFELISPFSSYSFETTKSALDTFNLRQLRKKNKPVSDLSHSFRQVSQLFNTSSRPGFSRSFSHLVFISSGALPTKPLTVSGIDKAIGFNTICPHPYFPLETNDHPLGWHIFYDAKADDPRSRDVHFMRNVSKVVRQFRTGISTGYITNLNLRIELGPKCEFESELQSCQLKRLRPGESWILRTKIGIPMDYSEDTHITDNPMMQDLIDQINDVIKLYSHQGIAQHIFSARVKYRHSLLPGPHDVCLLTHCTIDRPKTEAPQSPQSPPDEMSSGLNGYEQDDDSLSTGLGSDSEFS